MHVDGANWRELLADLERACAAMADRIEREPAAWDRARPGHWTFGQHADHVLALLELFPPLFADAARVLTAGTLPPVPGRGPLQSLFVLLVVRAGRMPRGGAAIPESFPATAPDRAGIVRRLRDAPGTWARTATGLDAAALDRLWIRNPVMKKLRWHYTLPEAARVQAVHVRHHDKQMAELAAAGAQAPRAGGR